MSKKYPRIIEYRRKPDRDKDGSCNYGKPCVICGRNTIGSKWVQWNYFRGEDEEVRICYEHWDLVASDILAKVVK